MKKSLYVLQVFIFSLLFISCSSEDNQAPLLNKGRKQSYLQWDQPV